MDRLEEIINTLDNFAVDYSTGETRKDIVIAMRLLRIAQRMRAHLDKYWDFPVAAIDGVYDWDKETGAVTEVSIRNE